jgi:serine/threonine protein kinase
LDSLQPGDPQRIGPYVLRGRLGTGGMGRVYLGQSPGGRLVAVKVIHGHLAEDGGFRARFAREVAAARKVGGMFTATVVGDELDGPVPWIATAYVPGPSLAAAVERHGPLPVTSVAALAAGLAEGLSAVHAAGVIHRDLTPSNVILAQDGPRIIDFGISSAVGATALTGTGFTIGSPGFMSPEQAEGKPVGPPSDIFSLGAVLTFAATGAGPFGTGSSASLLYKVVNGKPDIDGVPDSLRPLINRCLDKEPAHRPTANQVLTDVTAVYPPTPEMGSWLPPRIFDMASYGPSYKPHDAHQQQTHNVVVPPRPTDDLLIPPPPAPGPDPGPDPAVGRRRRQRRYIAGAVVLAAAAGALIAVLIPNPAPPVTRLLAYNQLQTGDCLTGANLAATLGTSNSWPAKVMSVPCDQTHLAEVYYANEAYWPKSEAFPSYNTLVDQANSQCENQQAAYTGVPYAQSSKTYRENVIGPFSSDIWARGDRELVCVAYHSTTTHPNGATMTASIKG